MGIKFDRSADPAIKDLLKEICEQWPPIQVTSAHLQYKRKSDFFVNTGLDGSHDAKIAQMDFSIAGRTYRRTIAVIKRTVYLYAGYDENNPGWDKLVHCSRKAAGRTLGRVIMLEHLARIGNVDGQVDPNLALQDGDRLILTWDHRAGDVTLQFKPEQSVDDFSREITLGYKLKLTRRMGEIYDLKITGKEYAAEYQVTADVPSPFLVNLVENGLTTRAKDHAGYTSFRLLAARLAEGGIPTELKQDSNDTGAFNYWLKLTPHGEIHLYGSQFGSIQLNQQDHAQIKETTGLVIDGLTQEDLRQLYWKDKLKTPAPEAMSSDIELA